MKFVVPQIHKILTQPNLTLEDLCREYLQIGCKRFKMSTGIISYINDGIYIINYCSSPLPQIAEGNKFNVEDTYCAQVARDKIPIAYHHVGKMKHMKCHPVYKNLKLESYISAPIIVNNEVFGTVNFTDTDKRKKFSEEEMDIITMMGQQLSNFISFRHMQQLSDQRRSQLEKSIGAIVHDLRSPLCTISQCTEIIEQSQAQMIIKEKSRHCLDVISTMLRLSTDTPINSKPFIISHTVQKIVESHNKSNVSFDIRCPAQTLAVGEEKMIERVIDNLVSNSQKFCIEDEKIIIRVSMQNDQIFIEVDDLGAGISQLLCENINTHYTIQQVSTSPNGDTGYGIGLHIVMKILAKHASNLTATKKTHGTNMKFSLDAF